MKKSNYFLFIILIFSLFMVGCTKHTHEYVDGLCECGHHQEEKVTVKYKVDDVVIEEVEITQWKLLKQPNTPIKEGYTFIGWYYQDELWNFEKDFVISNMILISKWQINQYEISFDTNGGSLLETIKVDYGSAIQLPNAPVKEGYDFIGWDKEVPELMPNENLALTAIWKAKQSSIYFDTDGGNSIEDITLNWGEKIEIPNNPVKEGYTFIGWNQEIPSYMPKENLIIKALWSINQYKISFDTDGGTIIDDLVLDYNDTINYPKNPEKENYEFIGWDVEKLPTKMPAHDIKLTAIWSLTNINLNLESFGGIVNNNAFVSGGVIKLPTPNLEGYNFKYWCSDKELLNKVENLTVGEYNNEKLYAYYEIENEHLKCQIATTSFNYQSSKYDQLVLLDSSITNFASLYWHKIAIVEVNGKYKISAIASKGEKLSTLGEYDYIILAYENYVGYSIFTSLNYKVGYFVDFLIEPKDCVKGTYTNIISFIEPDVTEELTDAYIYLEEIYGGYNFIESNINLINAYNEYTITWITSNKDVISDTGIYKKPTVTRNVTLTAYILDQKIYELNVTVKGITDSSEAIATGYVYTGYSSITQNAMDTLDIVYCAFLNLDENGDWVNLSRITNNINTYIKPKAAISKTKIVISINEEGSDAFSYVTATEELREKVANNIVDVIISLGIDGVDIDWETPTDSEKTNFTLFMKKINEKVKAINPEYLVTAAIGGGKWQPPKYDLTNSAKYLDYINFMLYSMATGNGYYQNSLYKSSKGRTLVSCSVDESVKIFNDLGISNSKLLIGIPFYTIVQTECEGPGSKTGSGKSKSYSVLYNTYPLSDTMKEYFDEECCVPYRYDPVNKVFISFENRESIKRKCEYINTHGLGGIMFWRYSQDIDDMLINSIKDYINK